DAARCGHSLADHLAGGVLLGADLRRAGGPGQRHRAGTAACAAGYRHRFVGAGLVLRQFVIVSALNFGNLRYRLWEALVIVIGMACVAGVLLSMLSMTEGLLASFRRNVDPGIVIVVAHAAVQENASAIPRDQARILVSTPGIAKAADGQPIADASMMAFVPAWLKKNGGVTFIAIRTFGPKGALLRPGFHMVAGRMFRPGAHELIAGALAGSRFRGMTLGEKVILPDGEWPIVGIFETGGVLDGQLVGDTESVMPSL